MLPLKRNFCLAVMGDQVTKAGAFAQGKQMQVFFMLKE